MAAPLLGPFVVLLGGDGRLDGVLVDSRCWRPEDSSSMAAVGEGLLDSIGMVGVLHGCIPRGLCG